MDILDLLLHTVTNTEEKVSYEQLLVIVRTNTQIQ